MGGPDIVGAFELNICGSCGPAWNSCAICNCCCPGMKPPSGPEWDAAGPGFEPLLAEAHAICSKYNGCCPQVHKMKADLDANWVSKANEYLGEHKLKVETFAFYTSDGKSAQPHLVLQIKKA